MAAKNKSIQFNVSSYGKDAKDNNLPENQNPFIAPMKEWKASTAEPEQEEEAAAKEAIPQTGTASGEHTSGTGAEKPEAEEGRVDPADKGEEPEAKSGKPKKPASKMREKFLNREFRQYVPFDGQSQMQLSSIKALARIGMKDFIFFATVQELDRRFPDGTVTPENIEKLKKDFNKLFGE